MNTDTQKCSLITAKTPIKPTDEYFSPSNVYLSEVSSDVVIICSGDWFLILRYKLQTLQDFGVRFAEVWTTNTHKDIFTFLITPMISAYVLLRLSRKSVIVHFFSFQL